jgi:glyoxylase-like metal-dependent hydrolase (beta-lactamase superfamily II)
MAKAFCVGACGALAAVSGLWRTELGAQTAHYSAELLPTIRRAAALIPGDPPTGLRVVLLNPFQSPLAGMVEGVSTDTVAAAYSVFQIRFPRGWITVDAAIDRAFVPKSTTFSDDVYAQIHEALRDARLVVVTHEHHDHVAGVLRSPFLGQIQAHTLLNRDQARSLIERPNHPLIKIDSAFAARYLVVDFEPIAAIAPGVVLIKAPGHAPGSQMVYVRLASGAEIVLTGDVAWTTIGIESQRQKPQTATRSFGGEDREAIAAELRWLREIQGQRVGVVVSHDVARINEFVARGLLTSGFDLRNR